MDAVKFSAAFGAWIKSRKGRKVVIGRDARISGEMTDDPAGDAQQLPDDLPRVASTPSDAQHPEMGARMRPDMPLPEYVRALEVGKGRVQVALRARLRRELHFRFNRRLQSGVHMKAMICVTAPATDSNAQVPEWVDEPAIADRPQSMAARGDRCIASSANPLLPA